MDDEFYIGIYELNKNIDFTNDFIFSDDFISIYLVKKIEKNKFQIIKTIYCLDLKPYSPRDIIFFDEKYQEYFIKFSNGSEYILNYNIFIRQSSITGIYNRNINMKIKDLLFTMVNHDNHDYNNIRDAILYFTEK